MPRPPEEETRFREAQRKLWLIESAPKMLDALRLIYFTVTTDHESAQERAAKIRTLCEAALKGTEDL